jgi:hypothetical protein
MTLLLSRGNLVAHASTKPAADIRLSDFRVAMTLLDQEPVIVFRDTDGTEVILKDRYAGTSPAPSRDDGYPADWDLLGIRNFVPD